MARITRVVVPGCPHHVTRRGNRRQETFFEDDDYRTYMELMAQWCGRCGVEVWAYCLMPNHVHLIVVPSDEEGLAGEIGEAHRRYTRNVNFRECWERRSENAYRYDTNKAATTCGCGEIYESCSC